jgi:hypothetical protein
MKQLVRVLVGLVVCSCSSHGTDTPDALVLLDADEDVGVADAGDGDIEPLDADSTEDADIDEAGGGDADDGGAGCDPASVAAAISTERIRATLLELTALTERSSHDRQMAAADLLERRLGEQGVTVRRLEYSFRGQRWVNLEVEVPGTDLAGEVLAAGAHYDSGSWDPARAPGADDDGSGTAGVVEMATVLAQCRFRRTVRLLLFSNEEVGTIGSTTYASDASSRGDDIRAFLNLDMIGYGPADEDLDIATRPAYEALAMRVVGAAERWAGLDTVTHIDDHCG